MTSLKSISKGFLKPLLYRFPPVFLSPAGLLVWFDTLAETKDTDGDVVEIGCYLGATAAMSDRLLKESARPVNTSSSTPSVVLSTTSTTPR